MTLATSGIALSIVLFNLTTGFATVASAMLGLIVLAMLFLAVASAFSSDWVGQGDTASTTAAGAEPSDD
ncbi:hypothetical protein [Natrinema salifodinae]|uniref:Uncharacterized protein n=1 Tax=Natrinema salifodinae TaxID=1202768 RepID=A0A1I0NNR6_9EURY|nr:hypothetical protein [Natrinema salifodinae]SEW02838.1 hypothetical protein SAMN05216285_1927 [Natrinema salifodinae]